MRYRLVGIDLDGTLLGKDGRISPGNRVALQRARQAGVLIVPCTGRSWMESRRVLAGFDTTLASNVALPLPGPFDVAQASVGVFVSGAVVADLHSGRVLDRTTLDPQIALRVVRLLEDAPDAVLIFRDSQAVGHDYLVTGAGDVGENTRWWFSVTEVRVVTKPSVDLEDLTHTLRVGMVTPAAQARILCERIRAELGDQVVVHSFEAVQLPYRQESLHCVEVFAPNVDKWHGLLKVAERFHISTAEIAVIGDEFNDLGMMQRAACRIAMGNASELIKSHANYVTLDHDQDGVAYALDMLLSGRWT